MGVGTVRLSLSVLDRAAVTGAVVLVVAMTVDLGSKVFAVSHGGLGLVAYNNTHNGDFTRRVVMSLVAIAFTCLAAVVARQRGIGRLWGAWIGVGLLVGGVLANGLSQFIWSRGTPDFIHFYSLSPDVWNIADFENLVGPDRRPRLDRDRRADRIRPRTSVGRLDAARLRGLSRPRAHAFSRGEG